jgi:U3 small nucleolar RNA-associated protein 3
MDEITRNSDDEMDLAQQEADSDFENQIEVGKLVDSDDETEMNPKDPKRWEKINKKEQELIDKKARSWGKNKDVYYETDTQYFEVDDDDTNAKLEEEEALRLQKEQAKMLNDQDFGLDEIISTKKSKKTKTDIAKNVIDAVSSGYELSKNDKIKQVIADSPELLSLLDEYTARMKELRKEVQPLLERARNQDPSLQTSEGISFLQLRFQLLLSYCIHIAFYLLLKAEGKDVKDHPVVKRLVHIRIHLEKIRPVMNQLKYQIEKLLKTSAMSGSSVVKVASDKEAQLMAFKPNLSSFDEASKVGDTDVSSHKQGKQQRTRLMGSTMFEEEERLSSRVQEEMERTRERASHSRLVKELRQDLSDRPEEESSIGTSMHRVSLLDKERMAFEEEHYMRLIDTREVKKRRRQAERMEGFDDIDDFADLSALTNMEKRAKRAADDDSNALHLLRTRVKASRDHSSLDSMDEGMDMASEITADDAAYYDQFTSERSAQKAARRAAHPSKGPIMMAEEDTVEGDDRRGAGKKILENKGLMRAPKKHKHARVALRAKHDKAITKRRTQVKEFTGKVTEGYGGEATGIKKTLIRSRKIKS